MRYAETITRADGTLAGNIPSFIPQNMIAAIEGASHFKIVYAGAEVGGRIAKWVRFPYWSC